jgi:DNA-binding transcriptional regulator YbjK
VTKQVPLGADRRDAIADAAIHLVATRGLRGLTHRAVDAEAGLPPGSTSYYLRTRSALLTACVNRMLARDLSAAPAFDAASSTLDLLVEMVIGLARDRADDQIARYELTLEASRQPELRAAIDEGARQLRALLGQLLQNLGVSPAAAWPVAAMMDGLMYDRVAGVGATLSQEDFETGVRRSLTALLDGLSADR